MSNFDLIDDYITNRLQGADREAFEKQLANDPGLKSEVELQKQIIEGVRTARAAELKTMLRNVPIDNAIQVDFSVVRFAAGLAAAGVLASSLYFYFKPEINLPDASTDLLKKSEQLKNEKPQEEQPVSSGDSSTSVPPAEEKKEEVKPEEKKEKKAVPAVKVNAVQKPSIKVSNPSDDLQSDESNGNDELASTTRRSATASSVTIDVDSSSKKYDFHYQFVANKLMLFGSFDKSLYELIEVNGENAALFLVYKDQYYLLDQQQKEITKLQPIKDTALIKKLKEYRN
ncbi:MAG: hypothetical protein ACOYW3_16260 [Bacteroidota bacterium]